jgi:hypothetical protein
MQFPMCPDCKDFIDLCNDDYVTPEDDEYLHARCWRKRRREKEAHPAPRPQGDSNQSSS